MSHSDRPRAAKTNSAQVGRCKWRETFRDAALGGRRSIDVSSGCGRPVIPDWLMTSEDIGGKSRRRQGQRLHAAVTSPSQIAAAYDASAWIGDRRRKPCFLEHGAGVLAKARNLA